MKRQETPVGNGKTRQMTRFEEDQRGRNGLTMQRGEGTPRDERLCIKGEHIRFVDDVGARRECKGWIYRLNS